jgi:hypothetical protein
MALCRVSDLAITETNDAFYRTFETNPEESLGRNPAELGFATYAEVAGLRDALVAQGSMVGVELVPRRPGAVGRCTC